MCIYDQIESEIVHLIDLTDDLELPFALTDDLELPFALTDDLELHLLGRQFDRTSGIW